MQTDNEVDGHCAIDIKIIDTFKNNDSKSPRGYTATVKKVIV